jgi:galactonate dehydratase
VKIVTIEALICNARMRNWLFVKVTTDQAGLIGWGEATLEWHTAEVAAAIGSLRELLVGEDPLRIEHLWQMMYRQHFWHGNGVVRASAIAGIDLALWDILGKHLNVPCHQLWGGRVRDYVRSYCHLGGGRMEDFYETPVEEPARFAELAQQAVADGFSAFKCMAVPPTMSLEGLKPVRAAEACVAAMRDAVGDSVDMMVDCHARPSPAMGMRFAVALESYGLYFLEEPCWPESVDGLASIAASVSTPIATGERLTNLAQFNQLFNARGCSVCQLDITHCGGITEARRIAALVEANRLSLAPHNPQGPISTAASLELGFSQPSYIICETVTADVPWREDIVQSSHRIQRGGRLYFPHERPGWGVEVNEAEIAKHPFEPEILQRVFYPDGSVGDW